MDLLYTATATARGGREGEVVSDDGALDLVLAHPKEVGGPGGDTTNPEQLLAAAWSSCFHNALQRVARHQGVDATGSSVTAQVGLLMEDKLFSLQATLVGSLPRVEKDAAEALMARTHEVCPISRAMHGNIPVQLQVTG
jgi:lipoyl-dependent peroxiredoxin